MRIMATHAFYAWIVFIRVHAFNLRPLARGIGEVGVATETEFTSPLYAKFHRFRRMLQGRTVAILTLYDPVWRREELLELRGMADPAILPALMLHRHGLPVLHARLPVPAVRVPRIVDSEIPGHDEHSGYQYDSRQRQNDI